MRHAGDADELLEVLGNELRPIVGDDARRGAGVGFAGALDDGFHVDFLHFFADFVMDAETAIAVKNGTKEVKGPCDVEVTDVHVPVLMRLQRLNETSAFLGDVGRRIGQESAGLQDEVDAGGAAGNFVGIEHHEGQATISFEGMGAGENGDTFFLFVGQPVVARHPGVVRVDFAEALFPVMELAGADADPGKEATDGDLRLVAPVADEIDDGVTGVVGHPAAF